MDVAFRSSVAGQCRNGFSEHGGGDLYQQLSSPWWQMVCSERTEDETIRLYLTETMLKIVDDLTR